MPEFREATYEDIPFIAAMEKVTFADAWTERSIKESFERECTVIVAAAVDGLLIGYCVLYDLSGDGEIERIAVDKRFRRRGVGRGLLDYARILCRERNIGRFLLEVRKSNTAARNFYFKYGFSEDGVRKNFYTAPPEDAVLMSINLK